MKYLVITLVLFLFGCKKEIKKFKIDQSQKKEVLKLYSDSTFSLQSETNNYSGHWSGELNEGDTIVITPNMYGYYNIMTATPKWSYKITNQKLTPILKTKEIVESLLEF